jgi:hypothetical protein
MKTLLMAALLMAAPFWETKPPEEWTVLEASQLVSSSPWVYTGTATIFLSSAAPVQAAEAILRKNALDDGPGDSDFQDFLEDNKGKFIIVSVPMKYLGALSQAAELRRMEESVLKVGKKKYPLAGHFLPTASDPYLRLVFPRSAIEPGTKSFVLDLYVPQAGSANPFHSAEFILKDLTWRGKPEF